MNLRTTLVLLLLLGGLVGAWALFSADQNPFVEPQGSGDTTRIFPELLGEEVTGITISDPTRSRYPEAVHLERRGERWTLKSQAVQNGRIVRARKQLVRGIIDVLQELTALRRVDPPPDGRLEAYGLDPARRLSIFVYRGELPGLGLEVGVEVPPAGVLVRRSGKERFHEVDKAILLDLLPPLKDLWDRRLTTIPVTAVKRILVTSENEARLELVWEYSAWQMRQPVVGRADRQRCDIFRNSLMNQVIQGFVEEEDLSPSERQVRFEVLIETGDEAEDARFQVCGRRGEKVIVKRGEGGECVLVDAALVHLLSQPPEAFRDRRINPIAADGDLARLVLRHAGRTTIIERVRKLFFRTNSRSRAYRGIPGITVDPERWNSFFRKLDGLTAIRFESVEPEFEPRLTMRVELGEEQEDMVVREVVFGPPAASGECPLRISGQPGIAWIRANDIEFLERPWWDLAVRRAGEILAWQNLRRVRISHRDGRAATFLVTRDAEDRMHLHLGETREGPEVPADLANEAVAKIVNFTVEEFAEEGLGAGAAGLESPEMTVAWEVRRREKPGEEPRTIWQRFELGAGLPGGRAYGRISVDPALIFIEKTEALQSFFRLLEFAYR